MSQTITGPIFDSGALNNFRDLFRLMPLTLDPDYIVLFDDFQYVGNDQTNEWTVVKDAGAAVAIEADTLGGILLLSSAATTDDDGASIQGNEIFKAQAGKRIWFEARVKVSDADQCDLCLGLTVNFAANPEAMLTAADRIVFQVDDGNASILCKTEKNGTETSSDSEEDLADDTFVKLGILVTGVEKVEFFVNRVLKVTHTTNIVDDENLTVGFFGLSGNNTGTHTRAVDYIFCVAER